MSDRPTIKDVAKAAGVSVATVSRALSGTRPVQPHLREKVQRAADDLSYSANFMARALRQARSGAIGMVVPAIDNPFFPSLVSATESVLQENGYALLLCSSQESVALESQRLDTLVERHVDGLLVSATSQENSATALSRVASSVPVVQLDQRSSGPSTPFVGVDDSAGMQEIIGLLHQSGHRKLCFVGAGDENWSGMRRREGFERWATRVDPSSRSRMRLGGFTREFGQSAARELLSAHPDIDAIVCANDLLALGALDAARSLGWSVPGRVAITGFDDIVVATASDPMLTTVRQPVERIVALAVETLLAGVRGEPAESTLVELRGTLIRRDSA